MKAPKLPKPPKERRHVIVFQHRFVTMVETLEKTHTIRPPRKREIFAGDLLRFRFWEGHPYRTPQFEFMTARCTKVEPVVIYPSGVAFPGRKRKTDGKQWLNQEDARIHEFARRDGFTDWHAMREWFHCNHALTVTNPFTGILIHWQD